MSGRYVRPDRYKPRPCPGCDTVGPLPEGKICEECTDKLTAYERFRPQIDQLAARETAPVFVGERCWVPRAAKYISRDFGDRDADRGTAAAVYFGTAMRRLLMETCSHRPVKLKEDEYPQIIFGNSSDGPGRELNTHKDAHYARSGTLVEMTMGAREALHELYRSINLLLEEAEQEGRARGQNLLQQLAAGEVNVNTFDEHLEDIARKQRESREVAERRTADLTKKKKVAR